MKITRRKHLLFSRIAKPELIDIFSIKVQVKILYLAHPTHFQKKTKTRWLYSSYFAECNNEANSIYRKRKKHNRQLKRWQKANDKL